jgi:hypothetical protein
MFAQLMLISKENNIFIPLPKTKHFNVQKQLQNNDFSDIFFMILEFHRIFALTEGCVMNF